MIEDVTVVEGTFVNEDPVVIIDAAMARKAIESGELPLFVHQALLALELSGKHVVFLKEAT